MSDFTSATNAPFENLATGSASKIGWMLLALLAATAVAVWWQRRGPATSRSLVVVDRAMLHRGAGVALVEVDGQRLLVGVSADGVRLLRNLPAPKGEPVPASSFRATLVRAKRAAEETR